ncbi:hypothetical protein RGCCGE502_09290 [Rhizobium grahamii CCGE 502]|uniref:Phage gp6-like head-tail connector protein n=1 Tax=Rhizobium grahamii CCGE 502 TaxID=990285 RepID=S3HIM9_9HYPH|nr:hypothetical protein RGCCGE502_09290 [Rhizobium grahamii CCGE 502]
MRVGFSDEDADIQLMIASARDHAEKYCNITLAEQTVEMKCDCWADLARMPVAPLMSVASIAYVDTEGAPQTVDAAVYELRLDGLEPSIVLAYGKRWPVVRTGSRITVTAVAGYEDAPAAVKHAILLYIADAYETRENSQEDDWSAFDALLSNYRRG